MSSRNLDHEVFISDSEDDAYLKAIDIRKYDDLNIIRSAFLSGLLFNNKDVIGLACFTARDCVKLSSLWHFTLVSPYAARMIKCCLYTRPTEWLMCFKDNI
uniref:Uncharacterized protein n=1 Tax=Glossina palpalis gambiensis TaxID=67801 RepID=A0A1B0BQ18_9MUSC